MFIFMLMIACNKGQRNTSYQALPSWVKHPEIGCSIGSARFRSDTGEENKTKALKLATERANAGLIHWIDNSCQTYLRDAQQLCSPCISSNDKTLEAEKKSYRQQLMTNKSPTQNIEQNDFIHVEICIKEEDIKAISDAAGFAGETLNRDIEYCMTKMTQHLKKRNHNLEDTMKK